jgi:hypothetical protein
MAKNYSSVRMVCAVIPDAKLASLFNTDQGG